MCGLHENEVLVSIMSLLGLRVQGTYDILTLQLY